MATTIQPELIPATDKNWKKEDALTAVTPMAMIQQAVTQGAGIEVLERLMNLQIRWEEHEAKKAFVEAMNAFKANPPEIIKNKHVKFGATEYDHATLDHVTAAVTEGLSKHGISHRWTVEQSDKIKVTCILTHCQGHSESTALEGPSDTSGSKNAIQAIGSAVTYLQRYSLLAATGLAAKNTDDDGASTSLPDIQKRVDEILRASSSDLTAVFNKHYQHAKKEEAGKAMLELIRARDLRREELQ